MQLRKIVLPLGEIILYPETDRPPAELGVLNQVCISKNGIYIKTDNGMIQEFTPLLELNTT